MPTKPTAHRLLIAPFPRTVPRGEFKAMNEKIEFLKKMNARAITEIRKGFPGGLEKFFEFSGIGKKEPFGLTVSLVRTQMMARRVGDRHLQQFYELMYQQMTAAHPEVARKAHLDVLQIVRQLTKLGLEVHVQDFGKRDELSFVRLAKRYGANVRPEKERKTSNGQVGTVWARDQYVKIGSQRIESRMSERDIAGEGGALVQIGPQRYLIATGIQQDRRIAELARQGIEFFQVGHAFFYDKPFSELMGVSIFQETHHIDYVLGSVPEKRIVAVDPRYAQMNRRLINGLEGPLGCKTVLVPESEMNRHPANFLSLGDGRALVDSGSPQFIKRLEQAGVEVVPTVVPTDNLFNNKGGLHCLFNEL